MTQLDQNRGGGLSLFFAFLGGALAGGAAAMLFAPYSGAETRRRIAGVAGDTREVAGRVPQALRDASGAAQEAFTAAMKQG